MPPAHPVTPVSLRASRQFALDVVLRLRDAGYEALWAGGCVRDQLLGREPKDYDVATNARPEEVRAVFGKHRTLAIGAAFGVVAVLGARGIQPIEVATFRRDAQYSDGRHPDAVVYSNAYDDAQRRDFTINGIFYDPVGDLVVDHVGGREDLRAGIVRAIGDPRQRFHEDKLRMARAVRFAATFAFTIDPATFAAVRELAGEIVIVSAERIAAELRAMLTHPRRRQAVELMVETGLLPILLPESEPLVSGWTEAALPAESPWGQLRAMLDQLERPSFAAALAVLLRGLALADIAINARKIAQRWRLTNHETATIVRLLECESVVRTAPGQPWPAVQRMLIAPGADDLLTYTTAVAQVLDGHIRAVEFCRAKLALPAEQLNPPLLITGDDLRAAGFSPGPRFRLALDALRDAQLEGQVESRDQALRWVEEFLARPG